MAIVVGRSQFAASCRRPRSGSLRTPTNDRRGGDSSSFRTVAYAGFALSLRSNSSALSLSGVPGIFVGRSPGLDSRAPGVSQASGNNFTPDIRPPPKVPSSSAAQRIDRQRGVHLRDVHLHAERRLMFSEIEANIGVHVAMCICNPTPSIGAPRRRKSRTMA